MYLYIDFMYIVEKLQWATNYLLHTYKEFGEKGDCSLRFIFQIPQTSCPYVLNSEK